MGLVRFMFLHEARTDWCMLLGCLAVILDCDRRRASGVVSR